MTILLVVLHVMVCFILIAVILLQAGRGQGLAGPMFASGNVQSLFGTRASDFLTKATSAAAICFVFTCLGLNLLEIQKSKSLYQVQQNAPLDLEQIKKALEKVKAEAGDAGKTAAETAGTAAGEAAAGLPQAAAEAVKEAESTAVLSEKAETAVNEAAAAADSAAKE